MLRVAKLIGIANSATSLHCCACMVVWFAYMVVWFACMVVWFSCIVVGLHGGCVVCPQQERGARPPIRQPAGQAGSRATAGQSPAAAGGGGGGGVAAAVGAADAAWADDDDDDEETKYSSVIRE